MSTLNDDILYSIGFNPLGNVSIQMQSWPAYDAYKYYITAKIIDNNGGITLYEFKEPISVEPNQSILEDILSNRTNIYNLFDRDTQNVLTMVTKLANTLNNNQKMSQMQTPNLNNMSNSSMNFFIINCSLEQRIAIRDILFVQLNGTTISDLSNLKMWSSALTTATNITEEISAYSCVRFHMYF